MPVSIRTMPSPAASAHALQCGTPGQGSGRRNRQTPGRTPPPRPTPRGRVGLRMARDGNVPATATSAQDTTPKAVMSAYFDALTRHDLDAIGAAWAHDGHSQISGRADAGGPEGVRAYWAELFGASPDLRFEVDALIAEGDRV